MGRIGGDPRSPISTNQKPDLDRGDDGEKKCDENQGLGVVRQRLGVVRSSFFSRFWPYGLFGAISGVLVVGLMFWLNWYFPNLPPVESENQRKRRGG